MKAFATVMAMVVSLVWLPASGETIVLEGGQTIEADILLESPTRVVVDLGYTVLTIPREKVTRIESAKSDEAAITSGADPVESAQASEDLYSVAELPEQSVRQHAQRWGEAVVMVKSPGGLGSGFIIDERGYVVTNAHVIEHETQISVNIFVEEEGAFRRVNIDDVQIVAVNAFVDLALLKFEPPDSLKVNKVFLAADRPVNEGDAVFAIGNPLGLERSVSEGIVSERNRAENGLTYIQTTTQINPGNSGGPLFNSRGEVIGVTNMGYMMAEGLNFAIPVRYVIDFLENRDAFAYDRDNPNSGYQYMDAPSRLDAEAPTMLLPSGTGEPAAAGQTPPAS